MAYVSLSEVKAHLRVEVDDDDLYLTTLVNVAEEAIANELGKPLSYYALNERAIPAPLHHAVMLLVGDLYNNRESVAFVTPHEVPRTLGYLLAPYKKYDANCSTDVEEEAEA